MIKIKASLFRKPLIKKKDYNVLLSRAQDCIAESGYHVNENEITIHRVAVMLVLASAFITEKKIKKYDRYKEMIFLTVFFRNKEKLDYLERKTGIHLSAGIKELREKQISVLEFTLYERVVFYYFCQDTGWLPKKRRDQLLKEYFETKKVINTIIIHADALDGLSKKEIGSGITKEGEMVLASPDTISEYLKKFVIGQDEAIEAFANVLYQYMKYQKSGKKPPKSYNVLLMGPTGSGKTTMMKALQRIMNVEMLDCTGISETGYSGRNASEVTKYIKGNGIVFLDEFDKILMPSIELSGRNCNAEVQSCFYKLMEDEKCLNVYGGAFEGINEIVDERMKSEKSFIGFASGVANSSSAEYMDVTEEDIMKYGATHEFMGRIDLIIKMRNLTGNDYYKILTESAVSPIIAEKKVAADCYRIELKLTARCYRELADEATREKMGARTLKQRINRRIDPLLAKGLRENCNRLVIDSFEEGRYFFYRPLKSVELDSKKPDSESKKEDAETIYNNRKKEVIL